MATVSVMKRRTNETVSGFHLSKTAKGPALSKRRASKGGGPSVVIPGRFGPWGGRYVPETLMAACQELERAYEKAKRDPKFNARLSELLKNFAGRPTPLFFAQRLTRKLGGA